MLVRSKDDYLFQGHGHRIKNMLIYSVLTMIFIFGIYGRKVSWNILKAEADDDE